MIFTTPWLLLGLIVLPLIWWLLRVTPPAPRSERFPAVRLLLGLEAVEVTPRRTPWWLLVLRLTAAAMIVVGLAGPVLNATGALPGTGPLLLVLDNGWTAAPDWPARIAVAQAALDRAGREHRSAALLTTAADPDGAAPTVSAAMPAADLRARLAALQPRPWPVDRVAAATALRGLAGLGGGTLYIADGLGGPGWDEFARALAALGPIIEQRETIPLARLLLPPRPEADRLVARMVQAPRPVPESLGVLAQAGDGRTLARGELHIPAGATAAEAAIVLPSEIRNRLARLVLEGPSTTGGVALLDERWRLRPVGLLAGDATTAETPLSGPLFYVARALGPTAELRRGDLATLLGRDLSVLVLADQVLADGPERDRIAEWVRHGGLLLRFAGPRMATSPDTDGTLLPVRLTGGDRQLGGAMSWNKPAGLAPFPPESPFGGLAVPEEVKVLRQVLAEPDPALASQSWARLADGTPLVTQAPLGAGRVVLVHVTANADWSNLPLSGLFVDMMRRLVALSAGVAGDPVDALAPVESMDGFGTLGAPPPAARALDPHMLSVGAAAIASPRHPPGWYGSKAERRAFNLGAATSFPEVAPLVSDAREAPIVEAAPERALGPWLLAAALALFCADLIASLRLRGVLSLPRAAALMTLLGASMTVPAHAELPALSTRLAYVVTGDATIDEVSRAGLSGLSDYVNRRTAAVLAEPAPVMPGQDDLSFYPLLYWPVVGGAGPPAAAIVTALNDYMAHGGIVLIDTRDAGASGGSVDLAAATQGMTVPPLAALTQAHVLARAFYLLSDFPGRTDGDTVWVQRDQDRSNDSVSPVVIGSHDWAAAWAIDERGRNPYATIPGGARQRTLAYRFGVNLVIYALTGNYKGDQVHVPALLERLGQ